MAGFRRDPIIGRWVIIAPERKKIIEPLMIEEEDSSEFDPSCPFCEGNEGMTPPEVLAFRKPNTGPNTPGWSLRVVPNKFPALQIEGELNREGMGLYDKMNGVGAHEVIIDSPNHSRTIADLEVEEVEGIIWAYRERANDLRKDPRLKYALIFKNHGSVAGASLSHPHSQLIATPIVPKRVKEELHGALEFFRYKDRCIFCDIIRQEIKERKRLVCESEDFISFTPYASRFPYEICLIPKEHKADFSDLVREEASDLARILKKTMRRLKIVLNDPPYNYMIHSVPFSLSSDLEDYHWHIEIIPKLVSVAGFEWGSGFYVNHILPEEAAKQLHDIEA